MNQGNSFHPMNEPYINHNYRSSQKPHHTIANHYSIMPSYESQTVLKHSHISDNILYHKPIYSLSSTNLNLQSSYLNESQTISNKNKNSLQYSTSQHNNNHQSSNRPSIRYEQQEQSIQSISNKSMHVAGQQFSSRGLHEKIYYLQKQLQQLTRLLQQESKNEEGEGYEEVAIENAQLTIKVRELQEEIGRVYSDKGRVERELIELGREYQKEHEVNNQLREKLMQTQQAMQQTQQAMQQTQRQMKLMRKNTLTPLKTQPLSQQFNPSTSILQQQNTRLTQQIQTLLSKLHNSNIEFNQQQSAKEQLMQRLNQQLLEIQKLRKQLSDCQVQTLQLKAINQYLKQQITQVSSMAVEDKKTIQEKYIRLDVEREQDVEQVHSENQALRQTIRELETQLNRLKLQKEQLKKSKSSPSPVSKVEPFKQLFNNEDKLREEITLLNQQLVEEKQRHQLIKTQYTEIINNLQKTTQQLQRENNKLIIENRTLKIEIEDRKKQYQQMKEQCQTIIGRVDQMKLSRSIEQSRSSETERNRYEENIRNLHQQLRQLLNQKNQHYMQYQGTIRQTENQLQNVRLELKQLQRNLELKEDEIRQKNYLTSQLLELQHSHQQLIQEVNSVKRNKTTLQQQLQMQQELWNRKEQSVRKDAETEIRRINTLLEQKQYDVRNLQTQIYNLQTQKSQLQQENQTLRNTIQHLQSQPNTNINSTIPPTLPPSSYSPSTCPLCPQVLKQFNIYKELMELKFQTMNEMIDQMKISFIRAQFQMKDQINNDKTKYEHWIQKYDAHDKEYRTLMERLWEWEKINAKNQSLHNHIHHDKESQGYHQEGKISINVRKPSNSLPARHLSDLQYDLYLIKLQNSTLRSQISNLEKQLSQRGQNPETKRQVQQLKKYSNNLLSQNEDLKGRLTQVISQRKAPISKKEINLGNLQEMGKGRGISIFERYSGSGMFNADAIQRSRVEQKALESAELLINKLKKQNDNLIEANRILESQLDHEELRYRSLVQETEAQRQRTRRQFKTQESSQSKLQVIDRFNLPIEYIKHHPEHKKLQTDFITLKRSYLQLQLQFKKAKQSYQEELQSMKIQNDFHRERIEQLEKSQKSTNLFSFNHKFIENNINEDNLKQSSERQGSENLIFAENKIKTLEEKVIYLQQQVQAKIVECQIYAQKYQELMQQIAFHPKTPRKNKQNIDRIEKLTGNIEVSPIQLPQWHQNSAQHPNSDRLFANNLVSFDEKEVQKLRVFIDKKMIQFVITPRENSSLIVKATWFIERLVNDIKELRSNVQILKQQRKVIMKQRNELKERLEDSESNTSSERSKPFAKHKNNKIEYNHALDESINKGLNKMKIAKGYQSVPKLNFDPKEQSPRQQSAEGNQNVSTDVIKEALELKDQRRNGLKKFQQQFQKLTSN